MDGGRAARWCSGVVLVGATALPNLAWAAAVPVISTGPTITGTPRVGALLTATATWQGDPTPTAAWAWLRCAKTTGACVVISGATSATFRPTPTEAGAVLRVRLRVTNAQGTAEKRSDPTDVVAAAPTPTPTPTPTATPAPPPPVPSPTPTPSATPVASPTAPPTAPPPLMAPAPTVAPAATAVPAPARLSPFPVVRVKGLLTTDGARVTLLSVRAPQGSRVRVRCRGADCPVRTYTAPTATGRLRPFERALRAGTRLEIRVTKPGYIGKSTLIVIRREAEPRRTDRCLPPGAKRAVRCPAS